MRNAAFFLSLVLLCSFFAATAPSLAAGLTVTGYGKVFYDVDTADIQFSISVRDKDVQQCKRQHDQIVARLDAYLENKGYPEGIVSLQSTILQRQPGTKKGLEDDYYLARSVYAMRTDRIKDLSSLQADIVELGIDEILSVTLFSSQQRQLEDEARRLALNDAKAKASLTASVLGWELGNAVTVSHSTPPRYIRDKGHGSRMDTHSGDGPMAASANYVDALVSVTFSYRVSGDETEKPLDPE